LKGSVGSAGWPVSRGAPASMTDCMRAWSRPSPISSFSGGVSCCTGLLLAGSCGRPGACSDHVCCSLEHELLQVFVNPDRVCEPAALGPVVQATADFRRFDPVCGTLIPPPVAAQALQNLEATQDTECTHVAPSRARRRRRHFRCRFLIRLSVYSVYSVFFGGYKVLIFRKSAQSLVSRTGSPRARPPAAGRIEPWPIPDWWWITRR